MPDVQVDHGDIELAAMYLRDLGFKNDGKHLYRAYWQLSNKCIDEWLAGMADGESQEFDRDQLIELFGQFPSREGPNDPIVADRKVGILGLVVQLSDYLSGLIRSFNASDNGRPSGTTENGQHGDPSTIPAADAITPKCSLEKCKPSERQAYFSFKLAEAKKQRRLEDREAYDFLEEFLDEEDWPNDGTKELTDYELPGFETWTRQLRIARAATNERKYTPRTRN